MKKKITRIWGIGLVVVLAASLLLSAVPVSAGELAWGAETIPSDTNKIIVDGIKVLDYSVSGDGQTVYAVAGTNIVYKSTDAGKTWGTKTIAWGTVANLVAVAPDDPDLFVVVDGIGSNTTGADVSTNGGTSFTNLGTIGAAITTAHDVAISPADGSNHYIGLAGVETTGSNDCNVWYYKLGAVGATWTSLQAKDGFGIGTGGATPLDDAIALAFSPSFASDKLLLAVTYESDITALTDKVYLEAYSFNHGAWNEDAAYENYPATVESDTEVTAMTGALSLAPDYEGGDPAFRIAFIGLDATSTDDSDNDGIYRMKDTTVKAMSDDKDVFSIDYDGTNLVAGQVSSNAVYYCSDPLASSPTVSTASSYKRLLGTNVIVAWAGADVLVATKGTFSAFGVSRDNGKSFNGLSMVDYATNGMITQDVAVSADGSVIYLMTEDSANAYALWRKAGDDWEMVFARAVDPTGVPLVRIAPDDADTIFITEDPGNAKTMFYSSEGGDTKWFLRTSKANITDMTVEDGDVLYVSNAGNVYRSTNSGFTWGDAKSAGVDTVWTIRSLSEDTVIASGTGGKVAYSTDGAQTWSKPHATKYAFSSGNVFVTASGVEDGDFIYCASSVNGTNVVRWELGSSTSWSDIISSTIAVTEAARGIELSDAGALYVLVEDTGVQSGFYRTLSPSSAGSTTTWSTQYQAQPAVFTTVPDALVLASGSTKLFAIDTFGNAVYVYEDTVAMDGPSLAGPGDGADISVNPVSGSTFTVSFTWARLSKATKYNLEIALDSSFEEKVVNYTGTSGDTQVISDDSSTIAQVVTGANFMPETTYYWRVRLASDGPIYSPYSEVRSFTIGALPEAQEPVIIQQPPAPVIQVPPAPSITLQPPDIILPAPPPAQPDIIIPAAPAPAPAIPAWALYVIIIIGAVLVIALIVLIMRTRRPV